MNNPQHEDPAAGMSQADIHSALFAQLVMQQSNMAMMLLGRIAHPESGKVFKDVEAARLFIDQLEMLEAKTQGNLTKEEAGLLKQSLMSLRLAFVEAVDSEPAAAQSVPQPGTAESAKPQSPAQNPPQEDESHKKFSKKY